MPLLIQKNFLYILHLSDNYIEPVNCLNIVQKIIDFFIRLIIGCISRSVL
jgi:hypothetical protein